MMGPHRGKTTAEKSEESDKLDQNSKTVNAADFIDADRTENLRYVICHCSTSKQIHNISFLSMKTKT